MNEMTPLQKKLFKVLVEEWGGYENCLKPQGCDWHKMVDALQQSMVVYIHLRHNGTTSRSFDYNVNRNTSRRVLADIGLRCNQFKDRLKAKNQLGL